MDLIDLGICIGLAITGGLFGMDKSHDGRDYIGPAMMAVGAGYAWWLGMPNLAMGIAGLMLLKLLTR